MLPCPDCKSENWLSQRHFSFVSTKTPAFVLCRKCDKKLDIIENNYNLAWHEALSESVASYMIHADPPPGFSSLSPKFETWLMKLMRAREKCPEVAEVVEEMKACMKTREPESEEGEEEISC